MVNKAILVGNLGSAPETGETGRGARWCGFSVATSRRWRDKASGEKKEKTSWHRVIVWGDGLATSCAKALKKGSKVYVEGEIETRSYEKDGATRFVTEIIVQGFAGRVVFCDGAGSGAGDGRPPAPDSEPEGWAPPHDEGHPAAPS
jgi:single-strand DNA-binding protein